MGRVSRLAAIAATLGVLIGAPAAVGAPRGCESADQPGCKSETDTKKDAGESNDFTEETTQQGRVGAPGTLGTQITQCFGPSGKPLRSDHPQCQ